MSKRAANRRGILAMILAVALQSAVVTTAHAELQLTRLIGTGDPAPGLPGITIESFRQPAAVDNDGNIAVVAVLDGPGVNVFNNRALLTGRPGSFSLLLRLGDPAPGLEPSVVSEIFERPGLGLSGHIAYSAYIDSGAYAFWSGRPDDFHPVLLSTDPAPGINDPNVTLEGGGFGLYVGAAGHVSFGDFLDGPGVDSTNDGGFWSQLEPGGPFALVSREGDQAPGFAPGVVRTSNQPAGGRPNASGAVAFADFVEGPGIDATNNQAIWSGRPGALTVRVRKGEPATPAGAGVRFNGFFGYVAQGQDGIVFDSVLTGTGVTGSNDLAAWTESNGVLNLLAREGDAAPGLAANQVFAFFQPYQFNEAGALLAAYVRGEGIDETNDQGVWLARDGVLEPLVWDGNPPLIDDPGVTLDHLFSIPSVSMNALGDVVLWAQLVGPGIDGSNDRAIWVRDHENEEWSLAAREGDMLDGRVIAGLTYEDIAGNGGVGLNDGGLLVFTVGFTDGDSARYAVQIPAPATIWLLLASVVVEGRRKERRPDVID